MFKNTVFATGIAFIGLVNIAYIVVLKQRSPKPEDQHSLGGCLPVDPIILFQFFIFLNERSCISLLIACFLKEQKK